MYEASDGTIHNSKKKASDHDALANEIKALYKLLGGEKKDVGCTFGNGGGYYQLTEGKVHEFDEKFLALVKKREKWVYELYLNKPDFNDGKPYTNAQLINSYILWRCLSDSNSPLYSLLTVRGCIDDSFRRWGQKYFALNPDKGTFTKLG